MSGQDSGTIETVLHRIPSGLFVLTAAHDGFQSAYLAQWVQQCSIDPPMVMIALSKGSAVEPLIRDSRSFVLCQIGEDDRFLRRKFETPLRPREDPFVGIPTTESPSGAPILSKAIAWLDCELARRIDLESDFAIYVGHVQQAALAGGGLPFVNVNDTSDNS